MIHPECLNHLAKIKAQTILVAAYSRLKNSGKLILNKNAIREVPSLIAK